MRGRRRGSVVQSQIIFIRPCSDLIKKSFFPSLQIAYSVHRLQLRCGCCATTSLCAKLHKDRWTGLQGLCTEYHKLSSLRSLNCSQVKIARTAKETSADDAVVVAKCRAKCFFLHQKQSDYAGKLWLKIVQSPVCVAFFQYRDDNRENFALLTALRALQCQCQPKGSNARIRKNVILENTSEIKTPPQLQCTGREQRSNVRPAHQSREEKRREEKRREEKRREEKGKHSKKTE